MREAARFTYRNLPLLLLQAREALMQHRRPSLRDSGLSDQQWRVLRVLAEHGGEGGLDTGRVARDAYIQGPSLTGMLVRMERDGLLTRQRSEADARRSVVSATPLGLELASSLSSTIKSQYHDIETRLGKAKLAQLYALLDELIEAQQPAGTPTEPEEIAE